jgi:ADP-heptose:LPS heptosyltransferase
MESAMRQAFPGSKMVGLSWASHRVGLGDSKSIPAADLLPLLEAGHSFWSLQYGDHSQGLALLKEAGHELYGIDGLDLTNDLDGVAALISALDVVVTCSNTVAHLSGALGKRTILLAPGERFVLWYWGLEGDRTPWYPAMEILRGPPRKTWAELTKETVSKI